MEGIEIIKGSKEHYDDCKEALMSSDLGQIYYTQPKRLNALLCDGFSQGEVYVAVKDGKILGYMRFSLYGMFVSFPYLRSIAVKQEYRGQGIGEALLKYYETESIKHKNTVFLLVSDFNPSAKRLYERIGYQQIGLLPDLFQAGVSEYLMMKKLGV